LKPCIQEALARHPWPKSAPPPEPAGSSDTKAAREEDAQASYIHGISALVHELGGTRNTAQTCSFRFLGMPDIVKTRRQVMQHRSEENHHKTTRASSRPIWCMSMPPSGEVHGSCLIAKTLSSVVSKSGDFRSKLIWVFLLLLPRGPTGLRAPQATEGVRPAVSSALPGPDALNM
jgi:hypothetical protein